MARVTAAGVLLRARSTGRYLLVRRPSGLWETPGGRLERGETTLGGALRELQEETGFSGTLALDGGTRTGPSYVLFQATCAHQFRPWLTEHVAWCWAPAGLFPEPLRPELEAVIR